MLCLLPALSLIRPVKMKKNKIKEYILLSQTVWVYGNQTIIFSAKMFARYLNANKKSSWLDKVFKEKSDNFLANYESLLNVSL